MSEQDKKVVPISAQQAELNGLKVLSGLISRLQLANAAGVQFGGLRDLYSVFGWEKQVKPEQLLGKYTRQDIASRIVDAPPGATWSNPPSPKEDNELAKEWATFTNNKRLKLWNAMWRADRLARLGPYSLILFGLDDSSAVEKPASKATELLYVRPIPSRHVTDITFNTDEKSPRFGMPETYKIKFDDPATRTAMGITSTTASAKDLVVHHTRVVHVVETPLEDAFYATPILEKVYNLLDDLLKVGGGTAEMYWLTGNRGLHADIDKEMDIDPADAAALAEEIEEYQHQIRRVIRTRGVNLKVLDSNVISPKDTFEMIMSIISGTTGIPRRILLGSEAGQLASEQDRANWAERIEERRILFANPGVLDPTIHLLQNTGLLPEGDIEWKWPSAFIQNPLEIGQTQAQVARSVGNLSRQTGASTPMQLLSEEECRVVLGFEGKIPDGDLHVPPDWQNPEKQAERAGGNESEEAKTQRAEKKADQAKSDQ